MLRESGEDQDDERRTGSHHAVTSVEGRHTTRQNDKRTAAADAEKKGWPCPTDRTVGEASGTCSEHAEQQVETSVADSDCGFPPPGGGGGEGKWREGWETADERIQASLRGGVSLTILDVSSPLISADFVKK